MAVRPGRGILGQDGPVPGHLPLQLGPLPVLDRPDLALADPGGGRTTRVVHDPHAVLADGPHGQFGLEGHTELADHDDVEWGVEADGHPVAHGDTAPREGQDHRVGGGNLGQPIPEQCAGLVTVDERHDTPPLLQPMKGGSATAGRA